MGITASTNASPASQPAARIVGSHGYCIEGDMAYLNADIEWSRQAAEAPSLALQLWALPVQPASRSGPVLVAELPLPSRAAQEHDVARIEGSGLAMPPAGSEPYTMVLQISTYSNQGADTVHDQVSFAHAEQFVQPRLQQAGHRLEAGRVLMQAGSIVNPRAANNLSGSLVLELWALAEPYRGGSFDGVCIGSATLGRLDGQQSWFDIDVSTAAAPWPVSLAHSSLMLREWTAAGYVTRDYVNGEPQPAAQPAPQPVVAVDAEAPKAAAKTETDKAKTKAEQAKPAAVAPAKAEAAKPTAAPAKAKAEPEPTAAPGTVSINRADVAQLRAVKGLTKSVAQAIVASRPHGSVEGLVEVKGMGPKLLAKIRRYLSL